jgi:hypothetical protein
MPVQRVRQGLEQFATFLSRAKAARMKKPRRKWAFDPACLDGEGDTNAGSATSGPCARQALIDRQKADQRAIFRPDRTCFGRGSDSCRCASDGTDCQSAPFWWIVDVVGRARYSADAVGPKVKPVPPWEFGKQEIKMTDSRIRCSTVLTIAYGIAMLASNQAIAQTPLGPTQSQNKKIRIKSANEKKKADAAAKRAEAGGVTNNARTQNLSSTKKSKKSKGYKPPWVLWREAHPAEAEIEIQQAAAQMRGNEKRLGGIGFTSPPPSSAPKRQNRENPDGTTAAGGAP